MISSKFGTFQPHPLLRSGHLQTLAGVTSGAAFNLPTKQHFVQLPDNDALVLHENRPDQWSIGDRCLLLVHGLCGCHASPYMCRLAKQFYLRGFRVFRVDMRGCGAARDFASQLTHAGRGPDLVCALGRIADLAPTSSLGAIAVSLGGNQILGSLGKIGAGLESRPDWLDRLHRVAVVSPPIDLLRCSENMQRWILRPYNRYFIRRLIERIPPKVRQRADFQTRFPKRMPKTLRELDDQITGPLSGFSGAEDYYRQSSAAATIEANPITTLILAANDDPLIPIDCFQSPAIAWPAKTTLLVSRHGGHVGFIDRKRNCWMDDILIDWFDREWINDFG